MQANYGQVQIPMPTITDDPRWIGRFSREVRKSIAALRDRQVTITGRVNNAAKVLPLQIAKATNTQIYITVGLVNYTYYPTISGVAINNDPRPLLTISANSYIWIKCVGTFGSPDTYVVTIEKNTSSTPPAASAIIATGFTSCFLIGTVDFAGGVITEITNIFSGGNLGVESFGSTNMWWAT
jgi:hypothetical protein